MSTTTPCTILIHAQHRSARKLQQHLHLLVARFGGQLEQPDAGLWVLAACPWQGHEAEAGEALGRLFDSGLVSGLSFAD
ncbi:MULTISPECIES: hypothetical protein [unclassified Pseudomonas]|uniref:hypothetical protein n=1 Tax=unclassified Pseudomonas TaxID=196821 RepID=UPI002454DA0C|nr:MULTISPECIES: hypothetical protein [unclassified Pseudomonas]MDH4559800.1 hypothetical protein [Pseudomonas sp. BN411]MDH4872865.1 hypothetical protein [Pseudomonas sp. BN515]